MRWSRYPRRLLKKVVSILHWIDFLFLAIGVIATVYFLWHAREIVWSEFAKLALIGVVIVVAFVFYLLHLVRRRLASGIVSSHRRLSRREFRYELEECEAGYLFVGNSFRPYLDTFRSGYNSARGRVSLVLAPAETLDDAELGRAHLEVMEALRNYDVEFRTMERRRSWWAHVFNEDDEAKRFLMLGLNTPTGEPVILELEKIPKRYGLFEHFLSEVRDIYLHSRVKNVEIWSRDLKRLSTSQNKEVR